jgi:nucleotide-binding universal stress UspA family protein
MAIIKNILVPTDFSENSDFAMQRAVELAKVFNAVVHMVYVVPELTGKLGEIMRYDPKNLRKDLEKRCEAYFQEQLGKLPEGHGVKIETHVKVGVPFKQLLKYQKQMYIDLIVITSKGESAIEEVFFGGTSLKILRYAECSTLLVRKPKYL